MPAFNQQHYLNARWVPRLQSSFHHLYTLLAHMTSRTPPLTIQSHCGKPQGGGFYLGTLLNEQKIFQCFAPGTSILNPTTKHSLSMSQSSLTMAVARMGQKAFIIHLCACRFLAIAQNSNDFKEEFTFLKCSNNLGR